MKQYLILIAILVAGMVFVVSCSREGSQPISTDTQQRIAELERRVASLTEQTEAGKNDPRTWVLEKDVPVETVIGRKNENWLPFSLKVGDRVEGEVAIKVPEGATSTYTWKVVGQVKDPYGNVVVKTNDVIDSGGLKLVSNRGFPWRFAFIAYTEGEYKVHVFTYSSGGQTAHLKVTCYGN